MTPNATAKKFEVAGKIAWLWAQSELHRDWSIRSHAQFVLPAIENGQFLILEADNAPVASCIWTRLSLEAEIRYVRSPRSLPLEDWNSGDRLWFLDWVSPFSSRFTWGLQSRLKERFPKDVARAYRVKTNSEKARIISFSGAALSKAEAQDIRDRYFDEFRSALAETADAD